MLLSLIVYTFLLVILIFIGFYVSNKYCYYSNRYKSVIYRKNISISSKYFIVMISIYALFAGLRYDVGKDYLGYLYLYLYSDIGESGHEFLFQLLEDGCKILNFDYPVYFFLIAFIQIYFYLWAFKDDIYIFPFLILFFFCNGDWANFNNIMRCMIAGAIWLFSLHYIKEKRSLFYFALVFVAFLFHKTAIMLILCYPLLYNNKDYFSSIRIQFILFVSVLFLRNIFFNYFHLFNNLIERYALFLGYESYLSNGTIEIVSETEGTGIAALWIIGVNLLIIFNSKKMKSFYKFNKMFILIYNLYFIGILLFYIFPVGMVAITRPFRYFYLFQTIMYSYFSYYLLKMKGKVYRFLFYLMIMSFIGIFYMSIIFSNADSHFWYQFCFDKL